jgi:hypothetical protein
LSRMILVHEQIELDHLHTVPNVVLPRHQVAPLAVQIDEREIDQSVHDEHPHHREMPVARAAEPAAEGEPRGYRLVLERVAAEQLAFPRESWVRIEDTQAASDHDDDGDEVHPMGEAYDPVVSLPIHQDLVTAEKKFSIMAKLTVGRMLSTATRSSDKRRRRAAGTSPQRAVVVVNQ